MTPPINLPTLSVQAPLVGSPAPDFTATAVFDQEFMETKLSAYRVSGGRRPPPAASDPRDVRCPPQMLRCIR